MNVTHQLIYGRDVLVALDQIPDDSIQCVVTSPPYFGLRNYGVPGQIGLEKTPTEYVQKLVQVFREIKRVLKPDGIAWLNLGDSFVASAKGNLNGQDKSTLTSHKTQLNAPVGIDKTKLNLPAKNLIGIPWRVAFALQDDGWILRNDIIWHKPNPMPESVQDRCTRNHEYIFMLTKSQKYYYDNDAIMEHARSGPSDIKKMIEDKERIGGKNKELVDPLQKASSATNIGRKRAVGGKIIDKKEYGHERIQEGNLDKGTKQEQCQFGANRRTVWTIATHPYPEAHFATFPEKIPRLCILASTKPLDTVLDPFSGSGTTVAVAVKENRYGIGIDLNINYLPLAEKRINRIDKTEHLFNA